MKYSSTSFRFSSGFFFFFFFILFIVAAIAEEYSNIAEEDSNHSTGTYLQADYCMYTLGVKTGNVENAGTDSRISISMGVKGRPPVSIPNLKSKGVMPTGHDYFEKMNLGFFVVNGLCLPSTVCRITVASDGDGDYPGWYLEYVEITTIGPNRPEIRKKFAVDQWLASGDPYITVTSNGTGDYPGWYLEYVEITTIGPNRPEIKKKFAVDQWLASSDPYKLFITRNRCDVSEGSAGEEGLDIAKVDT